MVLPNAPALPHPTVQLDLPVLVVRACTLCTRMPINSAQCSHTHEPITYGPVTCLPVHVSGPPYESIPTLLADVEACTTLDDAKLLARTCVQRILVLQQRMQGMTSAMCRLLSVTTLIQQAFQNCESELAAARAACQASFSPEAASLGAPSDALDSEWLVMRVALEPTAGVSSRVVLPPGDDSGINGGKWPRQLWMARASSVGWDQVPSETQHYILAHEMLAFAAEPESVLNRSMQFNHGRASHNLQFHTAPASVWSSLQDKHPSGFAGKNLWVAVAQFGGLIEWMLRAKTARTAQPDTSALEWGNAIVAHLQALIADGLKEADTVENPVWVPLVKGRVCTLS